MKDYPKVNGVYNKFFCEGAYNHKPARVCVAVVSLPANGNFQYSYLKF